MHLKIRNIVLPLSTATLTGTLADPFQKRYYEYRDYENVQWSLDYEVDKNAIDRNLDDNPIQQEPYLYHHQLHLDISDWRDLAGHSLSWENPVTHIKCPYDCIHNGIMYIYEHAEVPCSRLQFGRWFGSHIEVSWKGLCNIYWSEEDGDYYENVPFELNALTHFKWISVHGTLSAEDPTKICPDIPQSTQDSFQSLLAAHLNPANFYQGDVKGNLEEGDSTVLAPGYKMLRSCFYPKTW